MLKKYLPTGKSNNNIYKLCCQWNCTLFTHWQDMEKERSGCNRKLEEHPMAG